MSRLVHVLREVTTRTPLWLFYQWVIFQLLSFSGENAWQNHYESHQHIKCSERSCYHSERLKMAFSYGCCKWAITAIQSLVGLIEKHENNWHQLNVSLKKTGFTHKCTLAKWYLKLSVPPCLCVKTCRTEGCFTSFTNVAIDHVNL